MLKQMSRRGKLPRSKLRKTLTANLHLTENVLNSSHALASAPQRCRHKQNYILATNFPNLVCIRAIARSIPVAQCVARTVDSKTAPVRMFMLQRYGVLRRFVGGLDYCSQRAAASR